MCVGVCVSGMRQSKTEKDEKDIMLLREGSRRVLLHLHLHLHLHASVWVGVGKKRLLCFSLPLFSQYTYDT